VSLPPSDKDSCWQGDFAGFSAFCCESPSTGCFDSEFTFERCCDGDHEEVSAPAADARAPDAASSMAAESGDFCFMVTWCCGPSLPCAPFRLCCSPGRPCSATPGDGSHAVVCGDGHALKPPDWLRVDAGQGQAHKGLGFSLQGTLDVNDVMRRIIDGARHRGPESRYTLPPAMHEALAGLDPCEGLFSESEGFGTCIQPLDLHNMFFSAVVHQVDEPLASIPCESCKQPHCRVYAASFEMYNVVKQATTQKVALAVPGACEHSDVALRLLPRIFRKRTRGVGLILSKVSLQQVEPGHACERAFQPSMLPPAALSLLLLILPRLIISWWRPAKDTSCIRCGTGDGERVGQAGSSGVVAADLTRAVALFYLICVDDGNEWPLWRVAQLLGLERQDILRLESLHFVLTVYFLGSCKGVIAFAGRLLRKVGRQVLVALFLRVWLPCAVFAPSPLNCLLEQSDAKHIHGYMPWPETLRWALRLVTMTMSSAQWTTLVGWATVPWAFERELQVFLCIGAVKVLDLAAPKAVGVAAVAFLAHVFALELQPGACSRPGRVEDLHYSLWQNRLPSAVALYYIDKALRGSRVLSWLRGRRGLHVLFCLAAPLAGLAATGPLQHLGGAWDRLGFPGCGPQGGVGRHGDMRYVVAELPFQAAVAAVLHLEVPVETGGRAASALRLLRDVGLCVKLGHRSVLAALGVHFPCWAAHYFRPKGPLEQQLLFFAPFVLATVALARLVHRAVEQPWSELLRRVSGAGGPSAARGAALCAWAGGYAVLCCSVWVGV